MSGVAVRRSGRLAVSFRGAGSGTAELTWGQGLIWRATLAHGGPIWLTGVETLPAGTTVEDVAGVLGFLMSRHQSLRTRFAVAADGRPRQVLSDSGEIWLEIADAAQDADPRKVASALQEELDDADLDLAADWPVRMIVVRHRGVPVYRVTAMCHLITDAFGTLALMRDLEARDPVTGEAKEPVTAMQPLEQAEYQRGPAGQRQNRACQQYFARQLSKLPRRGPAQPAGHAPRPVPVSRDPREPRYWQADFCSPATFLAMHSVAARLSTGTSPVLLAAFSVALARVTGSNPGAIRVVVNNRFRPRLADSVSVIMQNTVAAIDVAGVTFDEVVRRAASCLLSIYRHAYYDTVGMNELIEAMSAERGEEYDLSKGFNDRRMVNREEARSLPQPADLRAALDRTSLSWSHQSDIETDSFHIHIIDAPGVVGVQRLEEALGVIADAVRLYVETDTHYMAPADTEEVLRQVEAVTVAAAFDPGVATGVER